VIICPSILTADFCRLGETLDEAVAAGIEWIHLDVMDGNWVVNKTITFGPAVVRSIRDRLGDDVFIDCHLMVTNAEENWDQYVAAGVDLVIPHIEAVASRRSSRSCMVQTVRQAWCSTPPLPSMMSYRCSPISISCW